MQASDLIGKKIYELKAIAKGMLGVSETKEIRRWLKRNLGEYRSKFIHLTTERLPNLRYIASWLTLCAVLIHISKQQQLKIEVRTWREMSIDRLRSRMRRPWRSELAARNLYWRNAGEKNRDLSKREMVSLLEAVNYTKNVA